MQNTALISSPDTPNIMADTKEGFEIKLSDQSKSIIAEELEEVGSLPYDNDRLPTYLEAAQRVSRRNLPELKIAQDLLLNNFSPALLISNLPNDKEIPPTNDQCRFNKSTSMSEAVSITLLHPLGRLVTYSDKREGRIVSDLYPKESDKDKQLGSGAVFLEWHTDEAFHHVPPSFVCLYGVRGEEQAKTLIADYSLGNLPEDLFNALSSDKFTIRADGSHALGNQKNRVPVIEACSTWPIVRFDPIFTECDTANATQALHDLKNFALRRVLSFTIRASSALIFNNSLGLHARSDFPPRFDGTDRWLNKSQVVPIETPEFFFEPVSRFLLKPVEVA